MMSKLVPSPDWFVGLDSLNLCENGHFIDSVTVEVLPYLSKYFLANLMFEITNTLCSSCIL